MGDWLFFDKKGRKQFLIQYENGLMHGQYIEYSPKRQNIIVEKKYVKGKESSLFK